MKIEEKAVGQEMVGPFSVRKNMGPTWVIYNRDGDGVVYSKHESVAEHIAKALNFYDCTAAAQVG